MAKFEVYIPAEAGGFNITLKVSADNWMAALKAGMQKLGEQGAVSQNVMVDIQEDNSIHVTESASGRVFRIRELTEEEAAKASVKKVPTRPAQPAVKPAERHEPKTDTSVPAVKAAGPTPGAPVDTSKTMPMMPAPQVEAKTLPPSPAAEAKTLPPAAAPAPQPMKGPPIANAQPRSRPATRSSPRVEASNVEELEHPVKPVTGTIGRPKTQANQAANVRQQTEDMLADVFMRIAELDGKASIEDAMQFILDLAMEKVPCEAGSILRADGASGDLSFIVARGPKAKEIIAQRLVIPAGSGFAGFCSFEGVSVAVSDVEKDPRFYGTVGEKVDYTTKSLLCSPMMTHGRSFGCMQVINRKGGPHFLEHEVGVLSYLSHQAALYLNNRI